LLIVPLTVTVDAPVALLPAENTAILLPPAAPVQVAAVVVPAALVVQFAVVASSQVPDAVVAPLEPAVLPLVSQYTVVWPKAVAATQIAATDTSQRRRTERTTTPERASALDAAVI
jgi:hypothetical protein